MDKSYWEITNEKEMWLRTIGLEAEDSAETDEHAAIIFSGIPRGERCLEIGSGVGRLLRRAANLFTEALGVDYSLSLQRLSLQYLAECPKCKVVLNDGFLLPFPDNMFDFVYSYTVFHHMPEREMILSNLREVFRVLKPGSLCRIQTVRGQGGGYDGHVYPTTEAFWEEFRDIGFTKEKVEVLQSPRDFAANRIWVTARKPKI